MMIDDDDPDDGAWRKVDVFDPVAVARLESAAMAEILVHRAHIEDAHALKGYGADAIAEIGDQVEHQLHALWWERLAAVQRRHMH